MFMMWDEMLSYSPLLIPRFFPGVSAKHNCSKSNINK